MGELGCTGGRGLGPALRAGRLAGLPAGGYSTQATAGIVPAAKVAQVDLRKWRSGPAALRDRRALADKLLPVAQTYRSIDPDRVIYIAGDDDRQRAAGLDGQGRPKVNVGRVKAEEAASAIGSQAVFPNFAPGLDGTDWKDLVKIQGRGAAASILRTALAVADREQALEVLAPSRADADRSLWPEDRSEARKNAKTADLIITRILVHALDQGHEL